MSKNTKKGNKAPAKTVPVKAGAAAPAKKSYATLIALIVVLVAAVAIIAVMLNRTNNLNAEVDSLNRQLGEVSTELTTTIADKEGIEEQLAAAQEALDEATATLEESTARVATLEADLAALEATNAANVEQIAVLQADLAAAQSANATAQVAVDEALAALYIAQGALNGTPVQPDAEEPVVEEPVVEEPVVEEPVVEEPVVEEPVVEEPVVLPEVVYPIINVTEEGTVVETETAIVTVTLDENGAIATIKAIVKGNEIVDAMTAQFIGKTLPLDAAAFELDVDGNLQAIIDALNALAVPVEIAA